MSENPLTSWDDFPVHQSANFIAHAAVSDRNFYDRYYFFMHNCRDTAAIFGLGQYPNLGVTDAFVAVTTKEDYYVVRASKPMTDRMDLQVGPIRVEVLEPLKRLRVVCEPQADLPISMDVTWNGSVPAIAEPNQFIRSKGKVVFDTQRLAQVGTWEGTLQAGGVAHKVDPASWFGARDRSWGVRPVGEPEPAGIRTGVGAMSGIWNYFPMRFDDHAIFYINNEQIGGARSLEQGERVWPDGTIEQLGRPEWHHEMQKGTRLLKRSVISFPQAPGGRIDIECTPLFPHFLGVGTGYGLDQDWRHGMYQGPDTVVHGLTHKVSDIALRGQFAVVDHLGRFEYNGNVGWGLYEQAFIGAFPGVGLNEPTSMAQ